MARVERTVTIKAPVDRVYRWWARWEHMPEFWPRLHEIKRTGPFSSLWRTEDEAGRPHEWEVEIVEDLPQRRIRWESTRRGHLHRGQADFEALAEDKTRLHLVIEEDEEAGPAHPPAVLLADLDTALELLRLEMETDAPLPPLPVAYPYRDIFYKALSATAGFMVIAGVAWSMLKLSEVWMILVASLLVAATLSPAATWLARRGLPRAIAVTLTFLATLAAIGVLFLVLIPSIIAQGQELAARAPGYLAELQALLARLHAQNPSIPEGTTLMGYLSNQASSLLGNAVSVTTWLMWVLVVVLSILFISLFILLDGPRLQTTLLRFIPLPQKSEVPALLHTVQERVGQYMLGLAVICGLAGVLTWWILALMGVPYALLIGGVTALLQAIPFVGPLIGGGLAALIGLSKSVETALWTLLAYTVIQQVIGQFLFPLIMGRTIGMHPVWIAIALLVGGTLYGLVGAFLAIPVAIAISIILECYYFPWAEAKASEESN